WWLPKTFCSSTDGAPGVIVCVTSIGCCNLVGPTRWPRFRGPTKDLPRAGTPRLSVHVRHSPRRGRYHARSHAAFMQLSVILGQLQEYSAETVVKTISYD